MHMLKKHLGPGRTSGQNCFCCDKISDKYLFPVKFILLCLGSHAICIPVIHASVCTNENFSTPDRSVSRYHAILKTRCGFRFCWTFIAFNLHAG